jgi:hypothetical protein
MEEEVVIRGTTTISAHPGDPLAPVKPPMIYNPYFQRAGIDAVVVEMLLEQIPLCLEFFGFGAVTSDELHTVAMLT